MTDMISTFEFFQKSPNEEAARKCFETRRWGYEAVCGHCGSKNVVECKGHKPMPYRCKSCRKHFKVRTGTVLAESRSCRCKSGYWLFSCSQAPVKASLACKWRVNWVLRKSQLSFWRNAFVKLG